MDLTITDYATARERLLKAIVDSLSSDERCIAAWLSGSFGRDEADEVSDLDVQVVISERYVSALCARPWMTAGRTIPERLELFRRFGEPAIIHENHHNAPGTGTMTHVTYRDTALVVDWILLPAREAIRPEPSRLLLDKVGIAVAESPAPEPVEERQRRIEERAAFFWMMVMVGAKYLIRGDEFKFLSILTRLRNLIGEIQGLIEGQPWKYQPDVSIELFTGRDRQIAALRETCQRMVALIAQTETAGFRVEPAPIATVERLLVLAYQGTG